MPQGSFSAQIAFLELIGGLDNLFTGCPLHKYFDDTTLCELVQPKQLDAYISTYLADLLTWAAHNGIGLWK